jgi:hypothetical protein
MMLTIILSVMDFLTHMGTDILGFIDELTC